MENELKRKRVLTSLIDFCDIKIKQRSEPREYWEKEKTRFISKLAKIRLEE